MSEQSNEGQVRNPNEGGGATSDPNWQGDAGDQGNDLRLAEEQRLIREQGSGKSDVGGGYTGREGDLEEGEYTDQEPEL